MTENRSGGAAGSGPEPQPTPPALDEVLAAAARPAPVEPERAERALAAFRAARAEGALSLPTRPEDDWGPAAPPRIRARGLKAGITALVAGVLFGGVAMAAGAIPAPFGDPPPQRPGPVPGASTDGEPAPDTPDEGSAPPTPDASAARGERPPTAKDDEAHCRAYAKARRLDDEAGVGAMRERLEEAAGGPQAVAAYCADVLAEPDAGSGSGGSGPKRSAPPAADAPDTSPGRDRNDSPRHGQFPKD
ncbi:hypothetical protein AB0K02_28625 [Streptomyces sp. NPDC049597]|uniref:hypothetical protein n=1 Tax=Streptomyces sp. NPDC049597 TaxID=3155276 RepID=UPI00341EC9D6